MIWFIHYSLRLQVTEHNEPGEMDHLSFRDDSEGVANSSAADAPGDGDEEDEVWLLLDPTLFALLWSYAQLSFFYRDIFLNLIKKRTKNTAKLVGSKAINLLLIAILMIQLMGVMAKVALYSMRFTHWLIPFYNY